MERLVRQWLPDLSTAGGAESDDENRRVLVAIGDGLSPNLALDVAQAIGTLDRGEIILAYIVEVPLTVTIREVMDTVEETVRRRLMKAARRLEAEGISVRCVIFPTRYLAGAIDTLAKDLNADLVLRAVDRRWMPPDEEGRGGDGAGDTLFGIVTHAPL
jgi:nucleotide-binding universal stress UspA family protein